MKTLIFYTSLIILFIGATTCTCNREDRTKNDIYPTEGQIIKIIDGDTYDLETEEGEIYRIRMEGIDCPERGMPYYKEAKDYLEFIALNRYVTIKVNDIDRYDRLIAFTYLADGTELSHKMVELGLAWHFKKYNSDKDLADLEIQARKKKIGLWKDTNPMPPWLIRSYHKQGISTKDSFY